jgi:hypothetical protein
LDAGDASELIEHVRARCLARTLTFIIDLAVKG